MTRPARGRGRGRCGREPTPTNELSTSEPRRGREPVECLSSEAIATYREGTYASIRKLLEDWEGEIKHEGESKEEMENWRAVIQDPGNTRGRIT